MVTHSLLTAKNRASLGQLAFWYGVSAFGLMLIYFMLISALGLQRYAAVLLGGNALLAVAVFFAVHAYEKQANGPASHFVGLGLGFLVGLFGSALFAGFVFLYATVLSAEYSAEMRSQPYFNASLSPTELAETIMLFGVVVGTLTGYAVMMTDSFPQPPTYH